MEIKIILLFIAGIIIGMMTQHDLEKRHTVIGVVQIDHETGLCRFWITKDDLSNPKCKRVVCEVQHDAKITEQDLENSQEKQGL